MVCRVRILGGGHLPVPTRGHDIGHRGADAPRRSDRGPSIEAPSIIKRKGYYYLFDSRGFIVDPSYHIQVGRSRNLTGPYVDRDGVPLLEGGGTVVVETEDGVGGQDIIREFGRYYMIHHYYEWEPLQIRMQIRELQWEDGWPYALED